MTEPNPFNRPIGIDLFAGAGGMSLGFEQAGFDVVAAVEIDPVHCAVHKYNFPDCAVIPKSVTEVNANEIRERSGIGSRRVDCVFGGPPCQGFSMIGQRAIDDPRNRLVLEFVRLVKELDASSFVFENVKGLTVGKHKKFLSEIVEEFEAAGYQVRKPTEVLDAAHFGVPQHRERLILLGSKKAHALPEYPKKWTSPADGKRAVEGLPIGPNCADALGDLPDAEQFETLHESDAVRTKQFGEMSDYAKEMRCLTNGAWHLSYPRDWDPGLLTSSARTNHTSISRKRFAGTSPGEVEPISRYFKLAPNGLSNTLRAGTDGARGAFTSPRPIHYKYARCVTVREMARLHGYPDWFRLHGTKWHGARQIGNSVPPPLARAVAAEVVSSLNLDITEPLTIESFDDTKLLTMDLSEASAHFQVAKPNSRRTMKSGATKRKQEDIEKLRELERNSG